MVHRLELEALAEGIETPEQFAMLRRMGCDTIQGYLFSRPVGALQFEQLLISPPWNTNAKAA